MRWCRTGSCSPICRLPTWCSGPRCATGSGWVALAQMRPTTGPTALYDDMVGTVVRAGERPFVDAARAEQRICREGDPEWTHGVPVRRESIPVTRATAG